MPNYRESIGETTSWRRASEVRFSNPVNDLAHAGVIFVEEDVVVLPDRLITTPVGAVRAAFNPPATFALINPETGEPTGAVMSHMELYVALNSLYLDLALKRDAAAAASLPPVVDPLPEEP